ncbi:hypothetical protein JK154_07020 [Citrobacter sp. JGM124]|nr:hypothetical protein [Citrobacter sp. JGM124]
MHWIAVDTFTHPSNHSFFSIIMAERRSHMILWYQSQIALSQGDTLHIDKKTISINQGESEIILLNTMPFTKHLWQNIRMQKDDVSDIPKK